MSDRYKECIICAGNILKNKIISCPYCNMECCQNCVKTFLLSIDDTEPRCMNNDCKKIWSLEFLADNTPKNFHNHIYRNRRADILLERERSLLPSTQIYVEREIEKRKISKEITDIDDQIKQHLYALKKLRDKKEILHTKFYNFNAEDSFQNEEKIEKKQFIPCPSNECRGFISSNDWICGICNTNICKKCHIPINNNDEHKCDPNTLETIKFIKKDTKPCPSCHKPIHKIEGCDQMFCQAEDTEIWMWNGTKKIAKDIKTGDILIGDDGNPCIVGNITTGEDEMFEVVQRFGENYKVIGKHLLTLENNGEILDISVDDYVALSETKKRRGYHRVSCNHINWSMQPVFLDPYILGLWLGDGISRGDGFASNDIEIIMYWVNWASKNNGEVTHGQAYGYNIRGAGQGDRKSVGFGSMKECIGCKKQKSLCCASFEELKNLDSPDAMIVLEWKKTLKPQTTFSRRGKQRSQNPLKNALNMYGLLNNKHIPIEYLKNDKDTRMQLLAGIIDTDGNKSGNAYRISQSVERDILCKDIKNLAHSLGFSTTEKKHSPGIITFSHGKSYECKDAIQIRIMGKTSEIPVKLVYKKANGQKSTSSTIKIKSAGIGKYIGWEVSGTSHRYLLGDGTITHNCTSCYTPFSWKKGTIEKGIIHNPHYFEAQRILGRNPERSLGDQRCGGIPTHWEINSFLKNNISKPNMKNIAMACRLYNHIHAVELPYYRVEEGKNQTSLNRDLRVKYLLKDIDEKKWVSELKKNIKKNEKDKEIYDVLQMFNDTMIDLFRNLINPDNNNDKLKRDAVTSFLYQKSQLAILTNNLLLKISKRYNNVVPFISVDFRIIIKSKIMPQIS